MTTITITTTTCPKPVQNQQPLGLDKHHIKPEEDDDDDDDDDEVQETSAFQMPLQYPSYTTKADYESMAEETLDCLLMSYGLPTSGDVETKRNRAMGNFLWASDGGGIKKDSFKMPLNYPKYNMTHYEEMPEETLDKLLAQYGLNFDGKLQLKEKRKLAIASFLWES